MNAQTATHQAVVTGVAGNIVSIMAPSGSIMKNEVANILVGDAKLKSEVLRVHGNTADIQVARSDRSGNALLGSFVLTRAATTYHIDVYGNMLEYPGGRVVSHTAFSNRNSDSFLALFRSKGYYIEQMLEDSAEGIVDEFIKVTHTGKAGK